MPDSSLSLAELVRGHEEWRRHCLNLIASENRLCARARPYLTSDLEGRYGDYRDNDLGARQYRGNRWVEAIERRVQEIARQAFGAEHVELRPLSGHMSGLAGIMAVARPGDTLLEVGPDGGGHLLATSLAASALVDLDVRYLPFDGARYNVDGPAAAEMIRELRPKMVILGCSNFLFPHPVRELSDAVHAIPGACLAYDASHVLGLLAAGRFQRPLEEGADVVWGSTHKTLPEPQGGIVYSNDEALMGAVGDAIYPTMTSNYHLARIPALGAALEEMTAGGAAYVDHVLANAQALGEALAAEGLTVVRVDGRYSRSHTLLVASGAFATGDEAASALDEANIMTTATQLPAC